MNQVFKSLLSALISVVALTSCSSSDDPDTIIQYQIPPCFSYVTDLSQGVSANGTSMTYTIQLNYTKLTADVYINGLELTDNTAYPTITLKDVPWTMGTDGWKVIEGTNIKSTVNGFGTAPVFTSVRIKIFDRMVGEYYNPGFEVSFVLDNRFRVLSAIADQVQVGTSVSTSPDGEEFQCNTTAYVLTFNTKTMRASLFLSGAKFASQMPALDITFDNIPFTFAGNTAVLSCDALIPTINDTPYPAFPISKLTGVYNFGKGLELEFGCGVMGQPYKVRIDCVYGVNPS